MFRYFRKYADRFDSRRIYTTHKYIFKECNMAPKKYLKIEDKLQEAQFAIENTIANPTIAFAVAVYGYDDERLAEGKALYEEALSLHHKQLAEYGEKYEATEALHEVWKAANEVFKNTYRVARVALRHHKKAWSALYLHPGVQRSLTGWLNQAPAFYANITDDPELLLAMEKFGYRKQQLLEEQALVRAVEKARNVQGTEKGEAEEATLKRDEQLFKLDEWIDDFFEIATIALEDNPQQLEKIGIVAA
jgi:hypothetical protein